MASIAALLSPCAVMMMTAVSEPPSRAFRSTSRPSSPGMRISSSAASGSSVSKRALDFGGGGGAAIDGPRQLERVGGSLNRMTDADSDFAAGAEVQVWHAAFKTLQAGDNECSIHKR